MDTNALNLKFKINKIDIEVIKNLIGLADGVDTVEVQTNIGIVTIPKINRIELDIAWINEITMLKGNTVKVTVSYPKYFYKNNNFEITKQAEIEEVQEELVRILESSFNAVVDIKNCKHSRIDYPMNIEKIVDFRDWQNVFILIAKATSQDDNVTLYTGIDTKDKKQYTKGVLISLGEDLDINFYNQRQNLKRKTGEDIGKEVLRVETRLKRGYIIHRYLGTREVNRVKLKDIKRVSRTILKENILDKLVIELREQIAFLLRELQQFLKEVKRNDRDKLGRFVDLYQTNIFDYELVSMAIGLLNCKKHTKAKYRREVKEELTKLERLADHDIKYFDNLSRVNYLHYKILGKEYKEFDILSLI